MVNRKATKSALQNLEWLISELAPKLKERIWQSRWEIKIKSAPPPKWSKRRSPLKWMVISIPMQVLNHKCSNLRMRNFQVPRLISILSKKSNPQNQKQK